MNDLVPSWTIVYPVSCDRASLLWHWSVDRDAVLASNCTLPEEIVTDMTDDELEVYTSNNLDDVVNEETLASALMVNLEGMDLTVELRTIKALSRLLERVKNLCRIVLRVNWKMVEYKPREALDMLKNSSRSLSAEERMKGATELLDEQTMQEFLQYSKLPMPNLEERVAHRTLYRYYMDRLDHPKYAASIARSGFIDVFGEWMRRYDYLGAEEEHLHHIRSALAYLGIAIPGYASLSTTITIACMNDNLGMLQELLQSRTLPRGAAIIPGNGSIRCARYLMERGFTFIPPYSVEMVRLLL